MSRLLAPLLAVLVLAAAGCGGSGVAAGTSVPAGIVPAEAAGVLSVDLERLDDVPALRSAVAEKLRAHDLELEALGDEAVLVAVGDRDLVALTRLDEAPEGAVAREIDGWTALAASAQALDRYEAALATGTIEGSEPYRAASSDWPADALATAFVRGDALAGALRGRLGSLVPAGSEAGWVSAAVVVEDETLRVTGLVHDGAADGGPVPVDLLDRVPSGATAVVGFGPRSVEGELRRALPEPFEPLLTLASGGGVLAYGPGLLELTAVLAADDPEAVLRAAAAALGGERDGDSYRFAVGGIRVVAAAADGAVVARTSAGSGATGRPDALADVPEDATRVLYADVPRVLPLLALLGGGGAGPDAADLPVGTVAAWTNDEGDDARFVLTAGLR